MRISTEQEKLINGLQCERLSSKDIHLRQVDCFVCKRNESLATTLQDSAYEEDESGSTAYYLIKDKTGERILFYFSLKTGVLFDQQIDENSVKIVKKISFFVQDLVSQTDLSEEQSRNVDNFIEKVRSHKGVSVDDLKSLPHKNQTLFEELEAELSHNIKHVGKTYSGVELVHFCKNNAYDKEIASYGLPRNFGSIIFWKFIAPKIIEAREKLGIQFFFLFAADMSYDKKLIHYYSDLHFKSDDERTALMPVYDFACKFMYQPASDLSKYAEEFWENFNPGDEV